MIFFVQSSHGGPIKIGHTENLEKTMASLKLANPHPLRILATTPGSKADEANLHAKFTRFKHHGEWYEAARPIVELTEALSSAA